VGAYLIDWLPLIPGIALWEVGGAKQPGTRDPIAIHLPMFAAANALSASAKDRCPRLVALDEAFIGIDLVGIFGDPSCAGSASWVSSAVTRRALEAR
jgi:hypothetical protein